MALNRNESNSDGSNENMSDMKKSDKVSKSHTNQDGHPSRRKLRDRSKMQRERGVQRSDGLYLAADPTNLEYHGEEDVELSDGTNLQSYVIHRQPRDGTSTFQSSMETDTGSITGKVSRWHLDNAYWDEKICGLIAQNDMWPVIPPRLNSVDHGLNVQDKIVDAYENYPGLYKHNHNTEFRSAVEHSFGNIQLAKSSFQVSDRKEKNKRKAILLPLIRYNY